MREFLSDKMVAIVQVILTVLLAVIFIVCAYLTFAQINAKPEGIMMPDGKMETYDPFTRAKDLLVLILPVFTIGISFWLGYSVQEKKVNEAKSMADTQQAERTKADMMMAKIEGRMMTEPEKDNIKDLSEAIHEIMKG